MSLAAPSPADSSRFGLSIWRARCRDAAELERALAEARAGGCALLVLRFPAEELGLLRRLQEKERWLFGDTLVHWRTPPGATPVAVEPPPGYRLARAAAADRAEVRALTERAFAAYPGHYMADPRTADPALVAKGYGEWSTRFVPGEGERLFALVARAPEGELAGFLGVELAGDVGQMVLQAGDPAHQRKGLGRWLVASLHAELHERGLGLASSTQVHNLASQKTWARLGLEPVAAEHTVHVHL
jgi:ribosomal protein S18 acetylase RimI-like enzyme